jgi:hypothetical protein
MAYYIIKSQLTDYVLDVAGGGGSGHKVIPWDKHGRDNQVWYDDESTGTIRSKAGGLCLTVEDDQLVVRPLKQGDASQQWMRQGETIRNRVDSNQVLDIYRDNTEKQAQIGPYKFKGGKNQLWEFQFVGGAAPVVGASTQRREFYIVSELSGKVLDVAGEKMEPGAKICMWEKHADKKKNQLWYQDGLGLIRSALNDLTFSNSKSGEQVRTAMPSVDPRSQWLFEGRKIGSRAGEALDIRRNDKSNGAEVISYEFSGDTNQQWRQEFV